MVERRTDIQAALHRALADKKALRSKNNWAKVAGVPPSTVRDAFDGKNPTVDTLDKLAAGAGLTLAELLEYGDPDWEVRRKARAVLETMDSGEITALVHILGRRVARNGDAS